MIKKMIRAVLFVLGLALMIRFMTEVLRPRSREALSSSYYEIAGKGCDVLFVGNSLIMNAVYPMQLYEEYGMAGYNLGSGGQSLLESCYLIEDGIRRFPPGADRSRYHAADRETACPENCISSLPDG